jgi:hypothetical protein
VTIGKKLRHSRNSKSETDEVEEEIDTDTEDEGRKRSKRGNRRLNGQLRMRAKGQK